MEVLLLAVMGISNIICFLIGAKVWKMSKKGEVVVIPTANPLKAVRDRESKKEAARELEKINTILENMECYDGTSMGQRDVPGR